MKTKSESRIAEPRKKTESRKQKSAAFSSGQMLQSEEAGTETFGLQSSDFFRTSELGLRISSDSPSLKQFNSEF
jgi:hypothetical protein